MTLIKYKALGTLLTVILLQVVLVTHWVIPVSRRERALERDRGEAEPEAGGGRGPCCTMSKATADRGRSKVALLSGPGAGFFQEEATTEGPEKFSQVGKLQAWFFSAFYDRDAGGYGGPVVRLFGLAARSFKNRPVLCRFRESSKATGEVTTKGRMVMLPDDHMVKNPPFEVECPLTNGPLPTLVSVSVEKEEGSTEPIVVEYRTRRKRKREFTVCFASFHSNFNFTSQLVQSVELNLMLGAEHFFLYNTSISASTDAVIRHYQGLGIFTVVQWPVPKESWYKAQMSLINDCIYRNRNQSEYVVFTDTDEFIIPRIHMTWHDMVADLFRDPGLSHVFSHTAKSTVPLSHSLMPRRRLLSVDGKGSPGTKEGEVGQKATGGGAAKPVAGNNGQAIAGGNKDQTVIKMDEGGYPGGKNNNPAAIKFGKPDAVADDKNKIVAAAQEKLPDDKKDGTIQNQQQTQLQKQQQQLPAQPQKQNPVAPKQQQHNAENVPQSLAQQQPKDQAKPPPVQQKLQTPEKQVQSQNQPPPQAQENQNKPLLHIQESQQQPPPQAQHGQKQLPILNQPPIPNQPAKNPAAQQPVVPQWSKQLEELRVPKIPALDDKSEQELKQRRLPVAAFHFRCVFFDNRMMGPWQSMTALPDEWDLTKGEEDFITRHQIQPLSVFTRTDYAFEDKVRSKVIVRPEYVHTMGIHFVRKEVRGSRSAWVKPEVGLMHHYRFFDWKHSNNIDHTAFKFKSELIERLKVRFAALPKIFPQP